MILKIILVFYLLIAFFDTVMAMGMLGYAETVKAMDIPSYTPRHCTVISIFIMYLIMLCPIVHIGTFVGVILHPDETCERVCDRRVEYELEKRKRA